MQGRRPAERLADTVTGFIVSSQTAFLYSSKGNSRGFQTRFPQFQSLVAKNSLAACDGSEAPAPISAKASPLRVVVTATPFG